MNHHNCGGVRQELLFVTCSSRCSLVFRDLSSCFNFVLLPLCFHDFFVLCDFDVPHYAQYKIIMIYFF